MPKLKAVIDRFEEEIAVLKFDDGQTLNIAIDFLPEDAGEGNVLDVSFGDDKTESGAREQHAKSILNEILKKHPN